MTNMPVLPWFFERKLSRLHFCQHQKFRRDCQDILAASSVCISISCTSPYTVWWRRLTPSRVFQRGSCKSFSSLICNYGLWWSYFITMNWSQSFVLSLAIPVGLFWRPSLSVLKSTPKRSSCLSDKAFGILARLDYRSKSTTTHSAMPVDASQTQVWDQSHWSWNYIGIESWAAGTSAML